MKRLLTVSLLLLSSSIFAQSFDCDLYENEFFGNNEQIGKLKLEEGMVKIKIGSDFNLSTSVVVKESRVVYGDNLFDDDDGDFDPIFNSDDSVSDISSNIVKRVYTTYESSSSSSSPFFKLLIQEIFQADGEKTVLVTLNSVNSESLTCK